LNVRGGGKRVLAFGGEGEKSPKMSGRQLVGQHQWPKNLADGVWFAAGGECSPVRPAHRAVTHGLGHLV